VERERREQVRETLRVVGRRGAQRGETLARGSAKAGPRERGVELGGALRELAQREVQSAAPFAERRVRLREQPRNAVDQRKVDLAAGAAQAVRGRIERRAVAARARESVESGHERRTCGNEAPLCAKRATSVKEKSRARHELPE